VAQSVNEQTEEVSVRASSKAVKFATLQPGFVTKLGESEPLRVELGVEIVAITDTYSLKRNILGLISDTEYFEIIDLKKKYFEKIMNFGKLSEKTSDS
jgi:hypothetical protein